MSCPYCGWAHASTELCPPATRDDDLLIEHLLVALQLQHEDEARRLTIEVQRRGLVARAMARAEAQTNENRRRLGVMKGQRP